MGFWSRELIQCVLSHTVMTQPHHTQPSYMYPPPVSYAHSPSCLMRDTVTPWRALGSCAADMATPLTAASSGAQPTAPGTSCSLWMWREILMSPGLHPLATELTSWAVTLATAVTRQQLWSDLTGPRSLASHLNMLHCKCWMLRLHLIQLVTLLLQWCLCHP